MVTCAFLERRIPETLGSEIFPMALTIERAHRIGRKDEGMTDPAQRHIPPRAIVMKFLNYSDKVRTMKAARDKGTILFEGRRVMFFPDISSTGSENASTL